MSGIVNLYSPGCSRGLEAALPVRRFVCDGSAVDVGDLDGGVFHRFPTGDDQQRGSSSNGDQSGDPLGGRTRSCRRRPGCIAAAAAAPEKERRKQQNASCDSHAFYVTPTRDGLRVGEARLFHTQVSASHDVSSGHARRMSHAFLAVRRAVQTPLRRASPTRTTAPPTTAKVLSVVGNTAARTRS